MSKYIKNMQVSREEEKRKKIMFCISNWNTIMLCVNTKYKPEVIFHLKYKNDFEDQGLIFTKLCLLCKVQHGASPLKLNEKHQKLK